MEKLAKQLDTKSKHSHYQQLHPTVLRHVEVSPDYRPKSFLEAERQNFVDQLVQLTDMTVCDIGANTGYFTIAAFEGQAKKVVAFEGNAEHAAFLKEAVDAIGASDRIDVFNAYYDFKLSNMDEYDVILCYNVLHHLGDDFAAGVSKEDALEQMSKSLENLVRRARITVFQMGYNWQGNTDEPLTLHGTKDEIRRFVEQSLSDVDATITMACFDPTTGAFEIANENNLKRFDDLGEFANRPLFVINA